jgi:hypothetical protein
MVQVNRSIVISAAGITSIGVATAFLGGKPITRIVLGGYLLALALSVFDLFGGGMAQVAGAVAWLALVGVVLSNLTIWQTIFALFSGGEAKNSGGSGAGGGSHPTSH